jgi:hypothetical protein
MVHLPAGRQEILCQKLGKVGLGVLETGKAVEKRTGGSRGTQGSGVQNYPMVRMLAQTTLTDEYSKVRV